MTNAVDLAQTGTISSSWRNRIINGGFIVAQRTTSATVTAGTAVPTASTGYPCVDRWFVYSTGANVTAAQVAGSGSIQNRLQITGAASVTAIGVGQRIETNNSYDLNGKICTLSVDLANSVLTTVTWTASYANTSNTFGTIGTPTKTQIATGTFTVNSTVTNYTTQVTVPSAAVTGIEILFTVGAQTSGTWTIGNVQFEAGSAASPFEYRDYGRELIMCQRYFRKLGGAAGTQISGNGAIYMDGNNINFSYIADLSTMRTTPTPTLIGTANTDYGVFNSPYSFLSGFTVTVSAYSNLIGFVIGVVKNGHGLSNTPTLFFGSNTTSGFVYLSSEL